MSELEQFKPLRDGLLVERVEAESVTQGGIIIPDTAKEKPQLARVVSVGNGARDKNGNLIPMDVSVGDHVVLAKWGGTEIKLDGKDYLIVKQSEILGIDYSKSSSVNSCSGSCCSCKGC